MISKEAYRLIVDGDGHWYMMPVSKIDRFEELMEIVYESENSGEELCKEMGRYTKYAIDNPNKINIYHWEEI